jgi:predicted TIM-barrel fold metal-dependent hydrolase
MGKNLEDFRALGLPADALAKMLHANAERVFKA